MMGWATDYVLLKQLLLGYTFLRDEFMKINEITEKQFEPVERGVRHLGNFSAVEPVHSRLMFCSECNVDWVGCWDNFMCPECGEGELPSSEINFNCFKLMPNSELTGRKP